MSVPNVDSIRYCPCSFLAFRDQIADEVVQLQFARQPELAEKYGAAGRRKCAEDARYHVVYLAEAVAAGSPELFRNYTAWLNTLLAGLGIGHEDVAAQYEALAQVLENYNQSPDVRLAVSYLQSTIADIAELFSEPMSHLVPDAAEPELAQSVLESLLRCERTKAMQMIDAAMEAGMALPQLYLRVFQPLLREVGRLWQMNRISVAQEHYCTAAVQLMMGRQSEAIFASERIGFTVVAACVGDELHEVGLRMVADLLEAAGWDSHFLGANVPPQDLLRTLKSTGADVLCLSATLTSHLARTHDVIRRIREEPELQRLKIVVGGYPFNLHNDLWKRLDADGHATDGHSAVAVCTRLVHG